MSAERVFEPWYKKMGVELIRSVEGERGFKYEIGRKEEADGAVYIYVAKVVPNGTYAKSILRMPIKVAREIGKVLAEL